MRGVGEAVTCLGEIERSAGLAATVITQMELMVGCRNKAELRALDTFLKRSQIISLTEQMSDTAVDLLRRYRLSHGLLIADALIAATVIVLDDPFVTKNQRDYRLIPGLQLLAYPNPFPSP
jgi:hypothetical protein